MYGEPVQWQILRVALVISLEERDDHIAKEEVDGEGEERRKG